MDQLLTKLGEEILDVDEGQQTKLDPKNSK
jgi:hypothetical protein